MNDQTDNLKNLWQKARANDHSQPADAGHIIALAKRQIKRSIHLQLGTILILTITLVCLAAFFRYAVSFNQTISHVGTGLMLGGLAVRIVIELISIYLSNNIKMSETALRSNGASLAYFQFRKRVNGPVTITILVLYSIGFYMLTPEFSLYFSKPVMIMIDLSYILIALMITWLIRVTVKKETKITNEIMRIQTDINGD